MPLHVGISTKLYMSPSRTRAWVKEVCDIAAGHPAVVSGAVRVFVAPTTAALESTIATAKWTGVTVAAQDVSRFESGAYTGEVGAPFLAELGVGMVEIGHAERRRLFGETDEVIAAKVARAQDAGLVPLLCVGEETESSPDVAARACLDQVLAAAPHGPLAIAYEPVWAIGAPAPAPAPYVRAVVAALKAGLPASLSSSPVLYGGSAGPGLFASLRPEVDGLFLGRFAHDPANVRTVLDEAAALT
jgi:triosephosphate isomerase